VASAEEVSLGAIHSARNTVRLPSVIRLLEYRRIPRQTARPLAQKHPDARSAIPASIATKTLPSGELTLDHVIPRSRAGESAWENLVACCQG
jgi:5-methylcytosine-specific restriction endonuclease McrA